MLVTWLRILNINIPCKFCFFLSHCLPVDLEKPDGEKVRSLPQKVPNADPDLTIDSMVEVLGNPTLYGVIRWIGATKEQPYKQIAGLEMVSGIIQYFNFVYIYLMLVTTVFINGKRVVENPH